MISKEKLNFDATDADTLAASDKVGAHVLSDDGTAITHHTVGSDEGLDVYILNSSIEVTATDLDIRDLSFATDSVNVSGSEVSLDAATLAALETITVEQGTSPWVIGDGGGSITVDATDLDIRDLDAASDSVAAWLSDGAGNAITSSGGALDVNIQSSDIEIDGTLDVSASTTGAILASQLADRRFMWFQNLGNKNVFIGASGVTTANGIRMSPGAVAEFRFGPALSLHAVAAAGTQDCRVLEAS